MSASRPRQLVRQADGGACALRSTFRASTSVFGRCTANTVAGTPALHRPSNGPAGHRHRRRPVPASPGPARTPCCRPSRWCGRAGAGPDCGTVKRRPPAGVLAVQRCCPDPARPLSGEANACPRRLLSHQPPSAQGEPSRTSAMGRKQPASRSAPLQLRRGTPGLAARGLPASSGRSSPAALSSTPLTYLWPSVPPKLLASSTASLMATRYGISMQFVIS